MKRATERPIYGYESSWQGPILDAQLTGLERKERAMRGTDACPVHSSVEAHAPGGAKALVAADKAARDYVLEKDRRSGNIGGTKRAPGVSPAPALLLGDDLTALVRALLGRRDLLPALAFAPVLARATVPRAGTSAVALTRVRAGAFDRLRLVLALVGRHRRASDEQACDRGRDQGAPRWTRDGRTDWRIYIGWPGSRGKTRNECCAVARSLCGSKKTKDTRSMVDWLFAR